MKFDIFECVKNEPLSNLKMNIQPNEIIYGNKQPELTYIKR